MNKDVWYVYWNGVGTVRGIIKLSAMPYAKSLAGGEVSSDAESWTAMDTDSTPHVQIVLQSYTWRDWTSYFTSTSACHSPGITFIWNSQFMDFDAHGSIW